MSSNEAEGAAEPCKDADGRRRLSRFPLHKPFEKQPATTAFSEVALRLIVDFYSDAPYVIGTAVVICGHLLITARHVVEDMVPVAVEREGGEAVVEKRLTALQLLAGPEYVLWDVVRGWLCSHTDIAFLHLSANPARSNPDARVEWKQPIISAFPPAIGEPVAAFGYRESSIAVSKNAEGGNHYDLNDEPIVSVGIVRQTFDPLRDSAQLPFPCYQVSARFDGGMSGGPVFDETGALCGLVCSNIAGSQLDGEPVSYVTTLWPMFQQVISADRGSAFPRGIQYPVVELVRDRLIHVGDFATLANRISDLGKVQHE